jgi:hypothetical protein
VQTIGVPSTQRLFTHFETPSHIVPLLQSSSVSQAPGPSLPESPPAPPGLALQLRVSSQLESEPHATAAASAEKATMNPAADPMAQPLGKDITKKSPAPSVAEIHRRLRAKISSNRASEGPR